MWSVYRHTCPNGKIYIGITSKSIKKRLNTGYDHNAHFSRAIRKYGWENIITEILFENLTEEDAKQKEIELIERYQSTNPHIGYNISLGGESHFGCRFNHSDETKRKISEHNGRYWLGTKGARFGMTRLSPEDVDYIKSKYKRYSKDMNLRYFATKFNVSETVISRVVNGKYNSDTGVRG